MICLTKQERQFVLGYLQEQWDGVQGLAHSWFDENSIPHGRFQPFTFTLTAELGRGAPVPPPEGEYVVPWASVEEFRRRAAKLKEALHELQPQPQVEDNAKPSSTEEPDETER